MTTIRDFESRHQPARAHADGQCIDTETALSDARTHEMQEHRI